MVLLLLSHLSVTSHSMESFRPKVVFFLISSVHHFLLNAKKNSNHYLHPHTKERYKQNILPQYLCFFPFNSSSTEMEEYRGLKSVGVSQARRRGVVRAPSRLYRVEGERGGGAGLVVVGPEFVVRSKQPAKLLSLLTEPQVSLCHIIS